MRTIVDIPDNQLKALDRLGKKQELSRAELVRRAVDAYLDVQAEQQKARPIRSDIRGMAKSGDARYFDGLDALEYERKIRGEWDDRDTMYGNWRLNEKEQMPYDDGTKKK